MESNRVQMALSEFGNIIPDDKKFYFKQALERAADEQYDNLLMAKTKSPTTTLIFSIFLGGLGIDRFYIGDIGLGIAKLLFGWITFGLWPLIDIFFSYKKCKSKNLSELITQL